MVMRGNDTLSVILIAVFYSCIREEKAVHLMMKRCEARIQILLLLLTMPSMIGLIRSGLSSLDGSATEDSGCALQVLMTSDIIDSKAVLESFGF